MARSRQLPFRPLDRLREMWLGFIIKHQGQWTDHDEASFRSWAAFGHQVQESDYELARDQALEFWYDPTRRVILCSGSVCAPIRPRPTPERLAWLEQVYGCPVLISDCQNRCSRAPSAVLLDAVTHPTCPAQPLHAHNKRTGSSIH